MKRLNAFGWGVVLGALAATRVRDYVVARQRLQLAMLELRGQLAAIRIMGGRQEPSEAPERKRRWRR